MSDYPIIKIIVPCSPIASVMMDDSDCRVWYQSRYRPQISSHSLLSVSPGSRCLLFTVVFHPSWHARHFSCRTRCQRGKREKMMYILLIVSFTAQRKARHLIDSSLVWGVGGRGKAAQRPSITVIIIHQLELVLEVQRIKKHKCRLKVKRWETLTHSLISYLLPLCFLLSVSSGPEKVYRALTCYFILQPFDVSHISK